MKVNSIRFATAISMGDELQFSAGTGLNDERGRVSIRLDSNGGAYIYRLGRTYYVSPGVPFAVEVEPEKSAKKT